MKGAKQTTLRDQVAVAGIGVHSGLPVTLTLHPADDDTGIVFQRVAADGSPEREIRADVRAVTATEFATVLGDATGPLCSTAEHLLAALRGLSVDNVVDRDRRAGSADHGRQRRAVRRRDRSGRPRPRARCRAATSRCSSRSASPRAMRYGELRPYEHGFRVEAEIDFDHPLIGQQALALDIEPETFRREIARARTFGFMKDVAKLWSAGYALGASFENTLVVTEDRVLNPEGLRFADEFVRHKVLDAIGDLALAGRRCSAAYRTVRGGHKLNHAVLSALMADPPAPGAVVEAPATSRCAVRAARPQVGLRGAGLSARMCPEDLSRPVFRLNRRLNPGRMSA